MKMPPFSHRPSTADRMLGARPTPTSRALPSLVAIKKRLFYLGEEAGQLVLPEGHRYTTLTVDPHGVDGCIVDVAFDSPVNTAGSIMRARGGDTIPVAGRSVHIRVLPASRTGRPGAPYYGALPSDTYGTEPVATFWATNGTAPSLGRGLQPGDMVWSYSEAATIATGTDEVLVDSDDLAHLGGVPLTMVATLTGGTVPTTAAAADFPIELVYLTAVGTSRVWVFPGVGETTVVVPLTNPLPAPVATDPNRWRVLARNPTGAASSKDITWDIHVVYGHQAEQVRRSPPQLVASSGVANQWDQNIMWHPSALVTAFRLDNTDAGGVLEVTNYNYWPSVRGGPYLDYIGNMTSAVSTKTTTTLSNHAGPFMQSRVRHGAGVTGSNGYVHINTGAAML